jgi:Rps23 Pro-64 3,4-dihydroxylase Tpa1-like proline 4-hydroxylase
MILRDKGYIIGNGNEFFGPEYENILKKVNEIDYKSKKYCVFYSVGTVGNVDRTEMMSYEDAVKVKEQFIKEKEDLVQIWLYDYSFQEKTIIEYIFPKLQETWKDFDLHKNGFELAVYNKDCFIADHNDGLHEPRVCILICYLSDDWEKGKGGELLITDVNGNRIEIEPKFGNFVIFNFKEENLQHEVKKITDDNFTRRSLIQMINEEGSL